MHKSRTKPKSSCTTIQCSVGVARDTESLRGGHTRQTNERCAGGDAKQSLSQSSKCSDPPRLTIGKTCKKNPWLATAFLLWVCVSPVHCMPHKTPTGARGDETAARSPDRRVAAAEPSPLHADTRTRSMATRSLKTARNMTVFVALRNVEKPFETRNTLCWFQRLTTRAQRGKIRSVRKPKASDTSELAIDVLFLQVKSCWCGVIPFLLPFSKLLQ